MKKSIHLDHITLGVCYYPEQWSREMWRSDLRRMKAHGIETVLVFELAWSVIEPRENEWDFSLFDDFLGLVEKEHIQVDSGHPFRYPARLADPCASRSAECKNGRHPVPSWAPAAL